MGDSARLYRVEEERVELGERVEDEGPFCDARVGNDEVRGVYDLISVEKDIDINDAGAVLEAHDAAHLPLYVLEIGQEFLGRQVGIGGADDVSEPGLVLQSDGFAFVD